MSALRCAFCHDDLGSDERAECAGCKTILHWDCRALLGRCPTFGCRDSTFHAGGRVAVARPAFRAALARFVRNPPLPDELPPDPASVAHELNCEVCWGRMRWFVWQCPRCGARAHAWCHFFSRACPRGCDAPPRPGPAHPADEPQRDPATFKRALENLKKRPPR